MIEYIRSMFLILISQTLFHNLFLVMFLLVICNILLFYFINFHSSKIRFLGLWKNENPMFDTFVTETVKSNDVLTLAVISNSECIYSMFKI